MNLNTALEQCFGNGVSNGTSNAATNYGHFFQSVEFCGVAERTDKIAKRITYEKYGFFE